MYMCVCVCECVCVCVCVFVCVCVHISMLWLGRCWAHTLPRPIEPAGMHACLCASLLPEFTPQTL